MPFPVLLGIPLAGVIIAIVVGILAIFALAIPALLFPALGAFVWAFIFFAMAFLLRNVQPIKIGTLELGVSTVLAVVGVGLVTINLLGLAVGQFVAYVMTFFNLAGGSVIGETTPFAKLIPNGVAASAANTSQVWIVIAVVFIAAYLIAGKRKKGK